MKPITKQFPFINIPGIFGSARTKEILRVNPTIPTERIDAEKVRVSVYDYSPSKLNEQQFNSVADCGKFKNNGNITWVNIDGVRKVDIESIAQQFNIHNLIVEDILSINQRPKMDEIEGKFFCLLNMLYFNEAKKTVETEQISFVLGSDFLITIQEDETRDVFNSIRYKLRMESSNVRQRTADYLLYAMMDLVVDHYYLVMEKLSDEIEFMEEEVIKRSTTKTLIKINRLRKELIVLKRNITPVRDLIANIIRSESELLNDRTTKYFKDVYDHIVQAYDLSENYRDVMMSMQDLYVNNVNLKTNEVMKVMAVVTCLMAPATVIGGIFGMNFDIVPFTHHQMGFYLTVGFMLAVPVIMLIIFKRRGWF
jgi:magnesium transporter